VETGIGTSSHSYTLALENLRQTGIFSELCPLQLEGLVRVVRGRTYARSESVLLPGEGEGWSLLVLQGEVQIVRETAKANRLILGHLRALAALAAVPPCAAVDVTSREALVYRVPASSLLRMGSVEIASLMARTLAEGYADLSERSEEALELPVVVRLVRLLISRADRSGSDSIFTSHEQLAAEIGTSRQDVCTWLGHLKRAGLVDFQTHHQRDHKIRLLDRHQLVSIEPANLLRLSARRQRVSDFGGSVKV